MDVQLKLTLGEILVSTNRPIHTPIFFFHKDQQRCAINVQQCG